MAWARELHGFGWLRNLDAVGSEAAREAGRRLALEWIVRFGTDRGVAAEPAVAARRLISWLSHANLLLEDADKDSYGAVTASLGRQLAELTRSWRDAAIGYPRLLALEALAFATLSLAGHDRQIKDIETNLAAELEWQVLDDGGHVSRNPAVLVELLLDLLPLSQCFTARDRTLPKQLGEALERMLPMLRYLRLGDGMVARFNGVGCARPLASRPFSPTTTVPWRHWRRRGLRVTRDLSAATPSSSSTSASRRRWRCRPKRRPVACHSK